MPQMDGVTFLTLLRRSDHWSDVPVLVVTGFADNRRLVGQARKLGVVDVVAKVETSVEQLLALVERTAARLCFSEAPTREPPPGAPLPSGFAHRQPALPSRCTPP